MKEVTLNNGVKMPILGFGVYQITDAAKFLQEHKDRGRDNFPKRVIARLCEAIPCS